MISLRAYQRKAVESLKSRIERVLKKSDGKIVILKSPTGSGKTVMVSETLRQLVRDYPDRFSFVWVSVRHLHNQSKEKLEKYYEDNRMIQCSSFEDLDDKKIGENEILFFNWHSINKKEINIYVRDNEQDNNLSSIVRNTKDDGREIILVVDESHHTAKSERSQDLIDLIGPKITLEISATPQLKNYSEIEEVDLEDVKSEEMIKSEISINPEFFDLKVDSGSSNEIIIGQALKKREELADLHRREGSDINPLVLIQLPDNRSNLIFKKDNILRLLKDKFGLTEENGKLAVWLSEEKSNNLANIEKNNDAVEVLVFKQAIALGWDCPRASILVIFRESESLVFTIQTLGRIMRMPEFRYYSSEDLNKGFVFTNLPNIEIVGDYVKDYVTIYESKRDKTYRSISLPSVYLRRQRERTRLSGEFGKIFMDIAEASDLKKKILFKDSRIERQVIVDGKIEDIDKSGEVEHKGKRNFSLNEVERQQEFDRFIRDNCSPYAPADSSHRMKTAIYDFFNEKCKIPKYSSQTQKIVLDKENVEIFVYTINLAKEKYRKEVVERLNKQREKEQVPHWEVPKIIYYNSQYEKRFYAKSIMKPFYIRTPSKPENMFMEWLDKSDKVEWWFKNGESEIKYFAVSYFDTGRKERSFYVDFIVMFKDGSIGLFDTKSGKTAEEAGPKAEGLQKYIKENKDKKIQGGIVIPNKGKWLYNNKEKYEYDPNHLSTWKLLKI